MAATELYELMQKGGLTLDVFLVEGYLLEAGDKYKFRDENCPSVIKGDPCLHNASRPDDCHRLVLSSAHLKREMKKEKEAFVNGDVVYHDDISSQLRFVGVSADGSAVCETETTLFGSSVFGTFPLRELSKQKPESPEEKEEREKLEAAYDLYCNHRGERVRYEVFIKYQPRVNTWLRIVEKTGYRVEK